MQEVNATHPPIHAPGHSHPASPKKVAWGPAIAVTVTIVIYFLSQFLGSIVMLLVANLRGMSQAEINVWTEQTLPQFCYIVMVEGLVLGLLALFIKRYQATFKTLGLVRPKWTDAGYALLGFLIYLPLLIGVMAVVKTWFPEVNLDQQQQVGFDTAKGLSLVLVFLSLVVLPAVTEEILMRGFLYLGLRTKLKVVWAAIVTSLLFASAHLQFGSGAPLLWTAAIDTFILSLVLVWLREKTGRLWASIALHMLKNSIAFAALFIFVK